MTWKNLNSKKRKIDPQARNRPKARPPKRCPKCESTWEYRATICYNSKRKKKYLPWKYLVDFPKIGCEETICPHCLKLG